LKRSHPALFEGDGRPELALIALDPRDGAIRALVGGADYGRSQFDRARRAQRQPGSAFKPIVLAAALADRWPHLRPGTIVNDSPLSVPGAGPRGSAWKPRNWDGKFLGPIPLHVAVEKSRNLPFVRLGMAVGLDEVVSTAEAMGIRSPLRPLPSLSIGAQEVNLLDLAIAYGTLAADGIRPVPRTLEGVRARDGAWLERTLPQRGTGIDPRVARMVTAMLQGAVDRGTAVGIRRMGFKLPVAAKTGTSNDSRDAWTAGYTPDLVVVVWVGFDQNRSLSLSSTRAAVPFWTRFMLSVEPYLSGRRFPVGPTPRSAQAVDASDTGQRVRPAMKPPKPPRFAPPKPSAFKRPGKTARAERKKSAEKRAKTRKGLEREDRKRRREEAAAAREMDR
jgi:penicillin-binding protein 1B